MLNRWLGIIAVLCMLCANTALVYRELASRWWTGPAPLAVEALLQPSTNLRVQVGIFNAADQRIGTSWTTIERYTESAHLWSLTALDGLQLPGQGGIPPVLCEIRLLYASGRPDTLDVDVRGLGMPMWLRGENFAGEFACAWRLGQQRGRFSLDPQSLAGLRDAIRPFDRLPGLYVGRRWEVELFNPLAGMLPGMGGGGPLGRVSVEVTGRAEIIHPITGAPIEAFVVEAPQARAWVAGDGAVLRQQVDLPVVGTLTLVEEPFEDIGARYATQPQLWRDSSAEVRP